jgi:hypothetical protein
MLFKCHYHLHPLVESKRGVVDQKVEKNNSLDFLKWQLAQVNQQQNWPIDSIIKWMLKTSSGHCSGGKNMRTCFL